MRRRIKTERLSERPNLFLIGDWQGNGREGHGAFAFSDGREGRVLVVHNGASIGRDGIPQTRKEIAIHRGFNIGDALSGRHRNDIPFAGFTLLVVVQMHGQSEGTIQLHAEVTSL